MIKAVLTKTIAACETWNVGIFTVMTTVVVYTQANKDLGTVTFVNDGKNIGRFSFSFNFSFKNFLSPLLYY